MATDASEPGQASDLSLSVARYGFALAAGWTLLIFGMAAWVMCREMRDQRAMIRREARAVFLKDQAFRLWAAGHGGVYVPPTEHTPPNPHLLHITDRDVETTTGKKLTLMNPAYMVRQVMEDFGKQYGVKGRITSLKPLRPANAPDEWERAALESFERGTDEAQEFTEVEGEPHLRLMRPLVVEDSCLKCHAHQGYAAGQIRGGVAVSVPAGRALSEARDRAMGHAMALGPVWLVGLVGIASASAHIRRRTREHHRMEQERRGLQQQLARAQRLEAVGQLAGGVAHDFNNLLMGIINYVELCLGRIEKEHPVREWLDEIMVDAQRSADLTRQLLAFASEQPIVPRVLNVNDLIADLLKLLRRLLGEDIDLRWVPGEGLWSVTLDPSQANQLLVNLCINSRDAMDDGGTVTIETGNVTVDESFCASCPEATPGDFVLLAVSDDGCGMAPETLERIFEPFFTTKERGRGTGLGLSTVYGIVKQNAGFVNVCSEPGEGTAFRIHLPKSDESAPESWAAEESSDVPTGQATILLVEDEKSIRVTTGLFLEALGYTVLSASTPEDALRLAAERPEPIQLLITDVVLPGMNGRDLAQQLVGTRPSMKCLFMSGYTANTIAQRGVLADDVNFLSKPVKRDDLARAVHSILQPEEGSGPAQRQHV